MNKTTERTFKFKLSMLLYIFACLSLILGIVTILYSVAASRSVISNDIFFQLAGLEEIAQIILRPIQAVIINVGIAISVFLLLFAGLLYAIGRLLDRQGDLIKRIQEIENRVNSSNPQLKS